MKKIFKKILTMTCALGLCIICLTGCSWLKIDNQRYYNRVVASIGEKNFYKKDLIEAFNNYGYQYYESYGLSLEESVDKTIDTMIDRWLLLEHVKSIDKYVTYVQDSALKIKAEAFDYMQDSIFTFETQVREEWDMVIEQEEDAEEETPLRVAEEIYEPITYYEDGKVYRSSNGTIEDDDPILDDTITINSHFNKSRQIITDEKVSNEAWTRYMSSLQETAESEGRSTKESDVLLHEENRLIELITNNLYLEVYENDYIGSLEVDTQRVVDHYKKQYKAQRDLYLADENLYHTKMKNASSEYVYFHPNSGNEYVNVKHILIKFTDAQTEALKDLDKKKEDGKITEASYEAMRRNIVNQTTSTFEMNGEKLTWNAIVSTNNQTSVYEYVQSHVTGATLQDRCAQFNELMYIFNDDEGSMNSEFDYVVNLDTDVADQMVKEFADGVRALDESNDGEGAGSMDYIVSEYGIHIIFHAGNVVNLIEEKNIDNVSDADILKLLCTTYTTPESNKSIFNFLYEDLSVDSDSYDAKSQGDINTIKTNLKNNGVVVTLYEKHYKDLWED